ncbi:unnamed protein product [Arabis nemorensis]|uniref:Uncharacterized protein n=1 Tax=Arabis nemorensis TaxID=586526 RepID=A0A565AXJ6_9BRAS|nr:unnamed protein product [Arabis nemorensis]
MRAKAYDDFEKEDLHDRTASMTRMRFSSCSMVSTLTLSEPPLPPKPPDPPDATSSLSTLIIGVVLYGFAAASNLNLLLPSVGAGRLCTIPEFVFNGFSSRR